jgi:alkyl hydroperoxide reductase subunit AhpF
LRIETAMVVISFICFFLSIYFVMISLYMVFDELLTRQLLAVATSFFAGGTITAMSLTVAKILEKIYSRKRKTKLSTLF